MAATKKSTTKKKTGSGASRAKKTTQSAGAKSAKSKYQAELLEKEQRRRQFWALMLFALGLINVGITYIKGENLWQSLHNIQFGLISWCAYAVAPAMLAVAVLLSMGKIRSAPVTRVAQVAVLLLLLCATAQLFSQDPLPGGKFAEVISNVYQNGLELQGGGCRIRLNSRGELILSGRSICLEGNVDIVGSLSVNGEAYKPCTCVGGIV